MYIECVDHTVYVYSAHVHLESRAGHPILSKSLQLAEHTCTYSTGQLKVKHYNEALPCSNKQILPV